ncbi:MAG: flagellin [Rhodospirillales bacterium]|nr:flagellin [Rhodospirillales bacterium]
MTANISLSATARSNLLALQNTASLIGRTQDRLSTGLAIKSPMDDAVKYFQAKSLSDRASDLSERKDSIDQGVSTLETVVKATEGMEKLVKQMKGIVESASSQSKEDRKEATTQLKELASQIQLLVDDASYKGLNLLNSTASTLSVRFSEKTDSKIDVDGVNFNSSNFFLDKAGAAQSLMAATGTGAEILSALGFTDSLSNYGLTDAAKLASFNAKVVDVLQGLDKTISTLRAKAATIANNAAILNVRLDFTKEYVNVLQGGSDKLTLADLNEEGANILALQTRQQLGIQALSLAGQAEQSILRLVQ